MNLSRLDRNLAKIELGPCDLERALAQLDQCCEKGSVKYESGEEALEATEFCVYRSEADFLEVGCHGADLISLHSDRTCYDSGIASFFTLKKRFAIETGRAAAEQVIRDYYQLPRNEFEVKYRGYLAR